MPAYDYRCTADGCPFAGELTHRMSDPVPACPECGGELKRTWGYVPPRVMYHVTGFATTDLRINKPGKRWV